MQLESEHPDECLQREANLHSEHDQMVLHRKKAEVDNMPHEHVVAHAT